MKIILRSHTISRSELEAGLSLTRAFFPEARVEVEDELHKELAVMSGEIGIIEMEMNYPDTPWYLTGTYLQPATDFDQVQVIAPAVPKIAIKLGESEIRSLLSLPYVGKETSRKLLLKRGLLGLLSQVTGHRPPWGTLTGIRPSKILHRLMDRGYSPEARDYSLRNLYGIRKDKVQLLQEIVSIQRPFLELMKASPNRVALYIGIPFCPTRCSYCSFPAYSLKQGRLPLESYLKGLGEEIEVAGEWMREVGLIADAIYLGGGTPTILNTVEISHLISLVKSNIPTTGSNSDAELTVEAGRPDTLSQEKLLVLRESGVNRLSINPQTMHNATLRRIGRDHTVEDILRMYELARQISGWIINMDLIIGLPGEGLEAIQETLHQVKELNPDNLTVHALAIKRGSKEHERGLTQNLDRELEAMEEAVMASARSIGMRPYYLYRQKHIAGNLENIGFAKPGSECRYNIGIMEEYKTVIGLGAGASNKIVNARDFSLVNFQHPSNWQVYLEGWRKNHQKRVGMYL